MFALFSKKILQIKHLTSFIDSSFSKRGLVFCIQEREQGKHIFNNSKETLNLHYFRSIPQDFTNITAILGWGHKPTADKARKIAKEQKVPYIALEDGFYRSLGLGCMGASPLSLVVDKTGIYYDATQVSDLENILNSTGWECDELVQSAFRAMNTIITHNLSKYNHAPCAPSDFVYNLVHTQKSKDSISKMIQNTPIILLIDQTKGDASVALGLANEQTFIKMYHTAKKLYPSAFIAIKTHPDVLAGKKNGYLTDLAKEQNIPLIAQDFAPLSLLKQVDIVFTVTSQMGFDALLLAKEVHCFGMPFYAGWGLTHDHVLTPEMEICKQRRTKKRSIEELFVASCILYPRYVNPVTEKRTDIHEILELLTLQRQHNEQNKGFHACIGFSWWKHAYPKAYLQSTQSQFKFYKNPRRAVLSAKKRKGNIVAWASKVNDTLQELCQKHEVPLIRMEDGFIRSVGLGSNFLFPYSLVLDKTGMYYNPHTPSDLEYIFNTIPSHPRHNQLCQEAENLRTLILEKGLTKYNVGSPSSHLFDTLPKDKSIILVPGQVEDDASVKLGGQGITSNLELLKTVRNLHPNTFIIYKPHPDVEVKNRKGKIPDDKTLQYANIIIRDEKMDILLKHIHEVHTLTSLTGFEALLRGLTVHTYGMPFYAGWGLTQDLHACTRRKAKLTLNELIAGTLLLYPSYYDWNTEQFIRAKDICHRLLQKDGHRKGKFWAYLTIQARKFLHKVLP